jgi:hypothetical protein
MKAKLYAAAAALTLGVVAAQAQGVPDPGTLAQDADALFQTVSGITIGVVGFYMLIRIVKWVTKR